MSLKLSKEPENKALDYSQLEVVDEGILRADELTLDGEDLSAQLRWQ